MDPIGANTIASAIGWLNATLFGAAATSVAITVTASVGLLMLTGRVDIRRAAQVIFGCFIIFGASAIASGIMGALNGNGTPAPEVAMTTPPPPILPQHPTYPKANSTPYDPYAGAALPPR